MCFTSEGPSPDQRRDALLPQGLVSRFIHDLIQPVQLNRLAITLLDRVKEHLVPWNLVRRSVPPQYTDKLQGSESELHQWGEQVQIRRRMLLAPLPQSPVSRFTHDVIQHVQLTLLPILLLDRVK